MSVDMYTAVYPRAVASDGYLPHINAAVVSVYKSINQIQLKLWSVSLNEAMNING